MLNKHNLNIAALASKEASRFSLAGIHVSKERTAVTDGHVLMTVTRPTCAAATFPTPPGAPEATDEHKPFIMPTADALAIAKQLPKKSSIPVILNAAICVESPADSSRVVRILTTDLERSQTNNVRPVDGNFPDIQRVMPDASKSKFRICLDVTKLISVLQQFDKFANEAGPNHKPVRLYFTDNQHAVRIDADGGDGQHMTGVVMPFRCEVWNEMAKPKKSLAETEPAPAEDAPPVPEPQPEPIAATA